MQQMDSSTAYLYVVDLVCLGMAVIKQDKLNFLAGQYRTFNVFHGKVNNDGQSTGYKIESLNLPDLVILVSQMN